MNECVATDACKGVTLALTDAERQPCEVWTRVMGYHRPVSSFNRGKKGEHNERKFFSEAHATLR
jgi:anaerobic ribonucleoside-triphosphate reductase